MATVVNAEDTTVIKRDNDADTTVIKIKDEVKVLPVPHVEEKKTIIKKDNDWDFKARPWGSAFFLFRAMEQSHDRMIGPIGPMVH